MKYLFAAVLLGTHLLTAASPLSPAHRPPRRVLRHLPVATHPGEEAGAVIAAGAQREPGERNQVHITWVAQPSQRQGFLVQRSLDGAGWEDVAYLDQGLEGAGYVRFSYRDDTSESVYYRVGSYDLQGQLQFSSTLPVTCGSHVR